MFTNRLFLLSFVVLLVTAAVHIVATQFYLYHEFVWLDLVVHTLGGIWIGLLGIAVAFFSTVYKPSLAYTLGNLVFIGIGVSFICGFAWEGIEFSLGIIQVPDPTVDTVFDLVMDVVGGILAALYVGLRYYPVTYNTEYE